MIRLAVSAFALLLLAAAPVWAQDEDAAVAATTTDTGDTADAVPPGNPDDINRCTPWPNVPVNVKPVFDEAKYDYSQNLAGIQSIMSDSSRLIPEYHAVTMGVTRYAPELEFHVPIKVETLSDGLTCAYVQHVDITMGYRDVTVYVASEIPQDSCAFNETLGHEHKHIAANRAVLDEFVPLIEQRFKNYLKLNGVFVVPNPDYAQTLLNDKLNTIMEDMMIQMSAENMRRQRDVDSPEEYNRLSNVCGGTLDRIATDFRLYGSKPNP